MRTSIDVESITDRLNPAQRDAVLHRHGPLLILAGAGSGKTRVVTHRIARLVATGCPANNILAITFTNKAAAEMRDRTEALCGFRSPWITTFHSFAARVLRRHIYRIEPYDTSFSICDTDDCKALVKEILKDRDVDSDVWQPRAVMSEISRLKSCESGDLETLGTDYRSGQVLRGIYLEYVKRMSERNLLDFDDLLLLLVRLFTEHPDILERYRQQFEFLLIDEYQDTNTLQYQICHALASAHGNICITGDPDQSIYKWRGADLHNILNFEKDYPNAKVIKLEQNYRSTKNILLVANTLIANNVERKEKDLWTENEDGGPVRVSRFLDEQHEASSVVAAIRKLVDEGTPLGSIAIFYRINSLSRVIEQDLIYQNLPYNIVGGLEFFLRKEVKDVIAMLRILDNPRDSEGLKRVINVPPRGIGGGTLEKLRVAAEAKGMGLLELVLDSDARSDVLNSRGNRAVDGFRDIYYEIEAAKAGTVESIVRTLLDATGIIEHLERSKLDDAADRIANLWELVRAAAEFDKSTSEDADAEEDEGEEEDSTAGGTSAEDVMADEDEVQTGLRGFLELTAILGDVDRWERREDRISLMTIHSAKGLEFPVVFIIGCEEGILPLISTHDPDPDFEEERRLLYVGVTRAQESLQISHSASRSRYGRSERAFPSRFLRELQPREANADDSFDRLRMDHGTEESLHERGSPRSWRAARNRDGFDEGPSIDDHFTEDGGDAESQDVFPGDEFVQEASNDDFFDDGPTESPRHKFGDRSIGFDDHFGDDSPPGGTSRGGSFSGSDLAPGSASTDGSAEQGEFPVGCRIAHDEYGEGIITRESGFGRLRRVTVQFDDVGEMQFVAAYANLTRIQ